MLHSVATSFHRFVATSLSMYLLLDWSHNGGFSWIELINILKSILITSCLSRQKSLEATKKINKFRNIIQLTRPGPRTRPKKRRQKSLEWAAGWTAQKRLGSVSLIWKFSCKYCVFSAQAFFARLGFNQSSFGEKPH